MLLKETRVDEESETETAMFGDLQLSLLALPLSCGCLEHRLHWGNLSKPRLCNRKVSFSKLIKAGNEKIRNYSGLSFKFAVASMTELGFSNGGSLRELIKKVSENESEFVRFGVLDFFFGYFLPIEEGDVRVIAPIDRRNLRFFPEAFYTHVDQQKRHAAGLPDFDKSILERFYAVITRKRMPSQIVTSFDFGFEEPGDTELVLGPEEKILLKVKK